MLDMQDIRNKELQSKLIKTTENNEGLLRNSLKGITRVLKVIQSK